MAKIRCLAFAFLLSWCAAAQEQAPAAPAAPARPKVHALRIEGVFADLPEVSLGVADLLGGMKGAPKAFYELRDKIARLAKDPEVKTVLLDLSAEKVLNLPQVAELARTLRDLRAAGKTVHAYVENAGPVEYQLAAQADRILLAEMGLVDLRSLAMTVLFLKDALDLLGMQTDVVRVGEFKGAVEPFVLPRMSKHLREHYTAMLESMNRDVVQRIAEGRRMDPARVRELQQRRLFRAAEAKEAGLVDELVAWHGARRAYAQVAKAEDFELVDALPKKKPKSLNLMTMVSDLFQPKKDRKLAEPTLVVLHLSGGIADGDKPEAGSIVSGPTVKAIDELADSEHVKGVVLRVNSPGGSATASEAILLALKRLSAKKPVVVSMGELAASGGYYITCFGRPILAEAATLTGSIGVFGMRVIPGALMRRVGVHEELIGLDEMNAMDSITQPWSDAAKQKVQGFVDEVYERFTGHVAASRRMTREKVLPIAGGRVWSGAQAVELGLVDKVGGLDDALALLRRDAQADAKVPVVHRPEPKNFVESFLSSMAEGEASLDLDLLRAVLARVGDHPVLMALLRAARGEQGLRVQALAPEIVRVR